MNKKQFSKVLKAGMKYYRPNTKRPGHSRFMCHSLEDAYDKEEISTWEYIRAKCKIAVLIEGENTLVVHLITVGNFKPRVHITSRMCMDFWRQHIIGEI